MWDIEHPDGKFACLVGGLVSLGQCNVIRSVHICVYTCTVWCLLICVASNINLIILNASN
jgi:hypothetical protein